MLITCLPFANWNEICNLKNSRNPENGVDAQRGVEARLELLTRRIEDLTRLVSDWVWETDEDFQLNFVSPRIYEVLGFHPHELLGKTLFGLGVFTKESGELHDLNWHSPFRDLKFEAQSREGEIKYCLVSGLPIYDPQSEAFLGVRGTARDITEHIRMERQKSEFISIVSHELRTPLTSIQGALGLLTTDIAGALPEKAQSIINIAHKNSLHLAQLVNDILDMEKMVTDKMVFDIKPQDVQVIIEEAVATIGPFAEQHGVNINVQVLTEAVQADADSDRLTQVLNNLISNAIKFSPEGETVEVSVTKNDNFVRISVADHGPGIAEEFHQEIFQKFTQISNATTRLAPGTGLGLSIVKAISDRMNADVSVESTLGVGSIFHIDLAS
jgi:PAS domain S-box-containing protein